MFFSSQEIEARSKNKNYGNGRPTIEALVHSPFLLLASRPPHSRPLDALYPEQLAPTPRFRVFSSLPNEPRGRPRRQLLQ